MRDRTMRDYSSPMRWEGGGEADNDTEYVGTQRSFIGARHHFDGRGLEQVLRRLASAACA